jgi:hypothetical protein
LYHIENFNIKIIFYFVKVIVTSTYLRNNSRMPGSMLILSWVGFIFVIILHRAIPIARCKILTNIMPTHVKISIEPGIRELFRF